MTGLTKHRRSRRIKVFLWVILLLMISLVALVFIRYRISTKSIEQPAPPESTSATLSINNFEHTAIKDGKKHWALTAESAEMYSNINKAELKNLTVTFYRDDEKPVTMSADNGRLDIETKDLSASGHVIARHPRYRLKTEHLKYNRASHIIIIDAPVEITGDNASFSANSARYEINAGKFFFEGNVRGWIIGTFDL